MADAAARVFSGRYELVDRIARGGMAEVYLARDQRLDRPVAVKVLYPELSVDPAFVARFRREAQAAANLTHPNIVSIFDWGEQDGTYLIVMEYVDGSSLAAVVTEEAPLPADRAASIGADVASALAFAHRNGVVHRDVKPANVLIDKGSNVKVTDFGIARAQNTQDNLTQTGAVMGTAAYFSPEQAQGQEVDQRSDVYSLGCVLYEMATGQPPFAGDNPLAIAYKHVREVPASPRSLRPEVPPGYEAITMRCLAKEPDERYQSADDLRADLLRFRNVRPPVGGVPAAGAAAGDTTTVVAAGRAGAGLAGAGPADIDLAGGDRIGGGRPGGGRAGDVRVGAVGAVGAAGVSGAAATQAVPLTRRTSAGGATVVAGQRSTRTVVTDEPPLEEGAPRRGTAYIVLVIALVALLAGLLFLLGRQLGLLGSSTAVEKVQVPPNLVNLTLQEADARLRTAGLVPASNPQPNAEVANGLVFDVDPTSGTELARSSRVTLTVSTGPPPVAVPDVRQSRDDEARQALEAAGFNVVLRPQPDDQVAAGQVLSQDPPPATTIAPGGTVTLVVSSGREQVAVADVVGLRSAPAANRLGQQGFKAIVRPEPSDREQDTVIRTDPAPGARAAKGSDVTVVVSSGPAGVPVPSVVTLPAADARARLAADGFAVSQKFQQGSDPENDGRVIAQDPAGGRLAKGSTVTITVLQSVLTTTTRPSSQTTTTSTTTSTAGDTGNPGETTTTTR